MYLTATDDFEEVNWPAAGDTERTWGWDSDHCPRPLSPLANEALEGFYAAAFGGDPGHAINGYAYLDATEGGGPRGTNSMSMSEVVRVWEQERLPRIQQAASGLQTGPYEAMNAAELAETLPELFLLSAQAFALTIQTSSDMRPTLTNYLTFCGTQWGREGPLRGMRMIQGHVNATTESARALQELAIRAAASPVLRAALAKGDLEGLRETEGGRELAEGFDDYLETYGWRLPSWMQLERPTWIEDPSIPMRLAAGYLEEGSAGPAEAQAAAAASRDEEIAKAESELDGEKLVEFRTLLDAAKSYVTMIEGRALWQQRLFGVLRAPTMELGRKLVAAGSFSEADDVFYLDSEELRGAVANPERPLAETIASRRADLERWGRLIPPRYLGQEPTERPQISEVLMSGAGLRLDADEKIVNGFGASPGVVQGTARVVLDLADLHRVGAGDVLVTVFTAPTWTPAFGIAAAVVTDSGGILSHAAIAAREYALPAVVGTQVGTAKIPDGATVTVDGAKGIVRVED